MDQPRTDRVQRFFGAMQRILEYVVAAFLAGFAALSLVTAVLEFHGSLGETGDFTLAVTQALDAVLLTIILIELMRTILSRSPMARRLQEFLIIGVFSAVRYSLEIVAGARVAVPGGRLHVDTHADAQTVVSALAINAAGILLLTAALWLVRQQGREPA